MNVFDSDILYLYDAKLANPNGDPDEENKPRMDEATGRNLVSDVRLKRYLRDYWIETKKENLEKYDIWVQRLDDENTNDAKGRMAGLINAYNTGQSKKLKGSDAVKDIDFQQWLLNKLLDVRMFGATMPVTQGSGSITFTGPIQFAWGYSLHRVEINSSATITSHFSGRVEEGKDESGTFGKDWRVLYSLIGFYGIVSRFRADHTNLSSEDIEILDEAMLKAIPYVATSRSKIGQLPRLYLRVEYNENVNAKLGDMREDIKPTAKQENMQEILRDINQYTLDVSKLVSRVEQYQGDIRNAYLFLHPSLETNLNDELQRVLDERLKTL
jgi:CRISPR-associated protein Csh2